MGNPHAISVMENVAVNIGTSSLEWVTEYDKYLGVKLDSCLKFDVHIRYVKQKKTCPKSSYWVGSSGYLTGIPYHYCTKH